MRLRQWTAVEAEGYLDGPATMLRGSYFGELVLTPEALADLHRRAVAPIKLQWQPEVHQVVEAERTLRRMLGGADPWDALDVQANQLNADTDAVAADLQGVTANLKSTTNELIGLGRSMASVLIDVRAALDQGDLDAWQRRLIERPAAMSSNVAQVPRRLRTCRQPAGLAATNVLADIRLARELLGEVDSCLSTRLVAVVADAGCGKTQLAAEVTQPSTTRPAAILLHGKDLNSGQTLKNIAASVIIQGVPVPSMEALVAAVDAAGRRAKRRLPIVIDGLNEAEDPRDWKSELASLTETLDHYPYVLVVCTLRDSFSNEALPADVRRLEIPSFGLDTLEAVRRYFKYYRINPADAELPWSILSTLSHYAYSAKSRIRPATASWGLSICRARSLHSLTDTSARHRSALLGWRLAFSAITSRMCVERSIKSEQPYGRREHRAWTSRHSGVSWTTKDVPGTRVSFAHWSRKGYCIVKRASCPVTKGSRCYTPRSPGTSSPTQCSLRMATGDSRPGPPEIGKRGRIYRTPSDRHPLATDILRGLVGLVPRRILGQQLWWLLDEPLRSEAIREAVNLESSFLDAATVDELRALAVQPSSGRGDIFNRLAHMRAADRHPLNVDFLDDSRRLMQVADRDLRWTEWIRRNSDWVLADLR